MRFCMSLGQCISLASEEAYYKNVSSLDRKERSNFILVPENCGTNYFLRANTPADIDSGQIYGMSSVIFVLFIYFSKQYYTNMRIYTEIPLLIFKI